LIRPIPKRVVHGHHFRGFNANRTEPIYSAIPQPTRTPKNKKDRNHGPFKRILAIKLVEEQGLSKYRGTVLVL